MVVKTISHCIQLDSSSILLYDSHNCQIHSTTKDKLPFGECIFLKKIIDIAFKVKHWNDIDMITYRSIFISI